MSDVSPNSPDDGDLEGRESPAGKRESMNRHRVRTAGSGPMPDDTPVTELGLSPGEAALLSPRAAKLTKGDLLRMQVLYLANRDLNAHALMELVDDRLELNLTISDLHSLDEAFGNVNPALGGPVTAAAACCCCCTCSPCCSCSSTASVVLDPTAAPSRQTWRMT